MKGRRAQKFVTVPADAVSHGRTVLFLFGTNPALRKKLSSALLFFFLNTEELK